MSRRGMITLAIALVAVGVGILAVMPASAASVQPVTVGDSISKHHHRFHYATSRVGPVAAAAARPLNTRR